MNSFKRDRSLQGLSDLLNDFSKYNNIQGSNYTIKDTESLEFSIKLISTLSKWLLLQPDVELKKNSTIDNSSRKNDLSTLNCEDNRYNTVLTGRSNPRSPKFLIDFIPFGYDIDMLEVRILENYHVVDLFVIYESPRTQSAYLKPLLFKKSKKYNRFQPYMSKILHLSSSEEDIREYVVQTQQVTYNNNINMTNHPIHKNSNNQKNNNIDNNKNKKDINTQKDRTPQWHRKGAWSLEVSMRSEMIRLFTLHLQKNQTLSNIIIDKDSRNIKDNVWGIQNDADEIVSSQALLHFKYCESKTDIKMVYCPCFSFKKSFYWLQKTNDMKCFSKIGNSGGSSGGGSGYDGALLSRYLWRPGPYLWPLKTLLAAKTTLRYVYSDLYAQWIIKTKSNSNSNSDSGSKRSAGNKKAVIELTDANFNALVMESTDHWLVEFYAPWCGHCKALAPEWEEAAKQLKGNVKLGAVDATVHQSLASQYQIKGFPTIKIFSAGKNKKAQDYNGPREATGIVEYAMHTLDKAGVPPQVSELTSQAVFEDKCESGSTICVVMFVPHILDTGKKGRNEYMSAIQHVSMNMRGKPIQWLWSEANSQEKFEAAFDVNNNYPTIVVLSAEKKAAATMRISWNVQNILTFINGVFAGKEKILPVEGGIPKLNKIKKWDGKDGVPPEEVPLSEIFGDDEL